MKFENEFHVVAYPLARLFFFEKETVLVCPDRKLRKGKSLIYRNPTIKAAAPLQNGRKNSIGVCIKGEVYLFGGVTPNFRQITSIVKYAAATKSWQEVCEFYDERTDFCVSALKDNIYFLGGEINSTEVDFNLKFDPANNTWNQVTRMNRGRSTAACAVFKRQIVVCGGTFYQGDLTSVEAYDPINGSWSYMPSMVEERRMHKAAAVNKKFFAIGGLGTQSCEVYDHLTNKFTILNQPATWKDDLLLPCFAASFQGKLIVLYQNDHVKSRTVAIYNVKENDWKKHRLGNVKEISFRCCVKHTFLNQL